MQVSVTINKCHDCRHLDHSGAFTPGGAKLICGHPKASAMVEQFKGLPTCDREMLRKINSCDDKVREEGDRLFKKTGTHWKNRVLPHEARSIPRWCPLKNGYTY